MSQTALRSVHVGPSPESVRRARAFAASCCSRWGLQDQSDTVVLLVSELATNAIRHARAPVGVWLGRRSDRLVLSVQDDCREHVDATGPGELDEAGRGLVLVDALAERWGEQELADGKRVWAEVALPRSRAT